MTTVSADVIAPPSSRPSAAAATVFSVRISPSVSARR